MIVSVFKKNIDNFDFLSVDLSNSPLSNSTLIYKYIKDNNKIKNSIESFSKKIKEKIFEK